MLVQGSWVHLATRLLSMSQQVNFISSHLLTVANQTYDHGMSHNPGFNASLKSNYFNILAVRVAF